MTLRALCNWLAAAFAIVAAIFWFKSASARVPWPRPPGLSDGPDMVVDGLSFVGTATMQTRWNRRAAIAASIAAIFQGIAAVL